MSRHGFWSVQSLEGRSFLRAKGRSLGNLRGSVIFIGSPVWWCRLSPGGPSPAHRPHFCFSGGGKKRAGTASTDPPPPWQSCLNLQCRHIHPCCCPPYLHHLAPQHWSQHHTFLHQLLHYHLQYAARSQDLDLPTCRTSRIILYINLSIFHCVKSILNFFFSPFDGSLSSESPETCCHSEGPGGLWF